MIIDELIAILGYDVRGEQELAKFNRGLDETQRRAQVVAARMNAIGVAIGTAVGYAAVGAIQRLSSAIGSLPGEVLAVGQQFENLETILTTIEGSSEQARTSLDWVEEFAKDTPYDLQQVADAFVRLRAYGLDPMSGQLESIGDAAAGMGKTLMQGVEAIADAAQGENERLKEFGIRAKAEGDQITYSWQQNGQEMTRTVRKNGTEIVAALTEIFNSRFGGAMEELSKKQSGIIANLGDAWTSFLKDIGEKGYYDDITRRLNGVKDTLDRWDSDGTLDSAAQSISNFLTGTVDFIGHIGGQLFAIGRGAYFAANGLVELVSRVTGLDKVASTGVLGVAALGSTQFGRGMMMALAKRVPWIAALVVVDDLLTGLRGGDSKIIPYIESLTGGPEALKEVQTQFENLSSATSELVDSLADLFNIDPPNANLGSIIGDFFDQATVALVRDVANQIQGLVNAIENLSNLAKGDFGQLRMPEPENLPGPMGLTLRGMQMLRDWWSGGSEPKATDKSSRLAPGGPNPDRFGQGVPSVSGMEELRSALEYMNGNLAKMNSGAVTEATVNDNRQDNRQFPVSTSVTVNQTVQQASDAPRAAATATGNAVGEAAARQASRFEMEPAF